MRDPIEMPRPPMVAEPTDARSSPGLSVIIVNWNTRDITRSCLESVRRHLGSVDHEVIVVDNASRDGSAEMISASFPDVRLIRNDENRGFGTANNQAMTSARGDWLLILNSDTELIDDSVARLFKRVRHESGVGIAQCALRFPDGRLQHSVYRFPSISLALYESLGLYKLLPRLAPDLLLRGYWDHAEERDVDWVAGAFMLLPRAVFETTGGFDERLFMYGEDMEWCYRIREHGWRVRYYPSASIVHRNHASSEIRFGDERVALCLQRQRDIYAERNGPWRGALLTFVNLTGLALRTSYYHLRGRLGGPRAQAYRDMEPHLRASLRTLLELALGRR